MTKILHIITQSDFGGAQRYIFDLATNLDKSQYSVTVAAGGNEELFTRLKGSNLAVFKLKKLIRPISPISDILAYFEIKKLIKELKPDVVHLNSSKAGVLGSLAAKKQKVPKIIYTAHGFVFNEPLNPIIKWIYKLVELSNAKRVDRIIAVSEYDKQTGIKAGIDENKITTIHNGIDPNIPFLSREESRSKLNIQSSKPVIGCIANFYYTKGLDVLIQAMSGIDAQLTIIGDGMLRTRLEQQIKKLNLSNKVFLAGPIPSASIYLKAFDLFALASRKEGLSYTILEATSANIPIVATRVGGTPEIIQDNINGYLADPENPNELAKKISLALTKPLKTQLEDKFTLTHMLAKTTSIYQETNQ
jgi:glycosyltransferase involved in cell wall biosynthesis